MSVRFTRQIGGKSLETNAILRKENFIMQLFDIEGMCETEHERDVGVGARRPPFGVQIVRGVIATGRDANELDTSVFQAR